MPPPAIRRYREQQGNHRTARRCRGSQDPVPGHVHRDPWDANNSRCINQIRVTMRRPARRRKRQGPTRNRPSRAHSSRAFRTPIREAAPRNREAAPANQATAWGSRRSNLPNNGRPRPARCRCRRRQSSDDPPPDRSRSRTCAELGAARAVAAGTRDQFGASSPR